MLTISVFASAVFLPLSFITQAGIYMRDRKSVDAKHPFKRMCIRLNRRCTYRVFRKKYSVFRHLSLASIRLYWSLDYDQQGWLYTSIALRTLKIYCSEMLARDGLQWTMENTFFLNTLYMLYTSAKTKTIFFLWFSFQCSHKKVLCFDLILDTGSNCVRDLRGERRHRATGQVSLEPSRSPSKCRGMSSLLPLSSWSIPQFFFFLSTFINDSVTYLWPILSASFLCSCNYKYRYFFL